MKQIIFFLFITTAAIGQRDTLNSALVRTYDSIDTTAAGDLRYIKISYINGNGQRITMNDTIDVNSVTISEYIDSLIIEQSQDSAYYQSFVEGAYLQYVSQNTILENARRFLAKLWAIKP